MKITLSQPYSFCQLGKRSNQEDARFPNFDVPEGGNNAFIVCDGVGGQDKGEVASRTVADAIGEAMATADFSEKFGGKEFSKVLGAAYRAIDRAAEKTGGDIATTLVFVCFHAGGAYLAHVGDSRIYQIRPGVGIMYQTEDHSLVNALVHSGNITPEEAINHPQSNIITRCIRSRKYAEESAATAIQLTDIEPGDYFFLCTDGVYQKVDPTELQAILSSEASDEEKMRTIASLSYNSSDNNTAYLIRIADVEKRAEEIQALPTEESVNSATSPLRAKAVETEEVTTEAQGGGFFSKLINIFK